MGTSAETREPPAIFYAACSGCFWPIARVEIDIICHVGRQEHYEDSDKSASDAYLCRSPQGELLARKNCVKKLLPKAINVKILKRLDLTKSRCRLLASGYDPEIT